MALMTPNDGSFSFHSFSTEMTPRLRPTGRSSSIRRTLRIETLEVRNLLAADVESVWAPLQSASGGDVVGAIRVIKVDGIVGAGPRTRAPSTPSSQVVVAPTTTEVTMPQSEIPEGTFQFVERRSPPINVAVEQVIRMPENSGIPEGTIHLVDRPRPPVSVIALATGPAFLECPNDLIVHVSPQSLVEGAQVAPPVEIDKEPTPVASCEPVAESPPLSVTPSTIVDGVIVSHTSLKVRSIRPDRRASEFEARPSLPPVSITDDSKPSDNCSEPPEAPQSALSNLVTHAGHGLQARDVAYAELIGTPVGTKVRGGNKG